MRKANKPAITKKPPAKKAATKKSAAAKPKAQKPQGQQGELFKRLADVVEKLERAAERLSEASGHTHAQDEAIERLGESMAEAVADTTEASKDS